MQGKSSTSCLTCRTRMASAWLCRMKEAAIGGKPTTTKTGYPALMDFRTHLHILPRRSHRRRHRKQEVRHHSLHVLAV